MIDSEDTDPSIVEPLDDRDEEKPEYLVDPMLSGSNIHIDGRTDRHRGLRPDGEYEQRTAAEVAAYDPYEEADL